MSDERMTAAADVFVVGPEPTWHRCACGQLSARLPCFTCTVTAERIADGRRARDALEATIPPRFAWSKLSAPELHTRVDCRRRPFSEVVERLLGAHNAVVCGGSGTGKTSLAVACLRERIASGGRFVSAVELATARIQHAAGDGEASVVATAVKAPLLLLDDMGEEQHTATSAVRDVIRLRHDAGRPTWVTTGLRSRELVARYGDGIRRRLLEGAFVAVLGPSPAGTTNGS